MRAILLQIVVFICTAAAIVGIKLMDFPAWITYPLVAVVVLSALSGFAGAHYER